MAINSPMGGRGRMMGGGGGHGSMLPVEKAKNAKGAVRRIWGYVKQEELSLIIIVIMVILSTVATLFGTVMIGYAIDNYIVRIDFFGLAKFSFLLFAIYGVSTFATWLQIYLMAGVSQRTVQNIRNDVFDKLQNLPVKFFDKHTRGELMSRLANDVDTISQTLSQGVSQLVASALTIVGTLIAMLFTSPILTVVALTVIPASMFVAKKIAKNTKKYFSEQQKNLGGLNGLIEESITGQRIVKVFGREQKLLAEFDEKNEKLKKAGLNAQIFSGLIMPFMNMLNNANYALMAFVGGWLVISGSGLTIGKIANMLTFSKQFTRPLNEVANLFNTLQSAIAGAERVFEILDEPSEPSDGEAVIKEDLKGQVEFNNVTFSYKQGEKVLDNVSLTAKPGSTIALVGPTGAGKTTIVNLLTRFYDVEDGEILVDGKDIRTLDRPSLRQTLGMVLQDTYLFSATIKENIRYGRLNATDDEVINAAKLANVHRFIKNLPDGYDTMLTEEGDNISQGQKQLLAIARVILADPSILILDEATSSIDTRTERNIQQSMLALMNGRTSFVIAHRLSTIREADEILVINEGKIIERGNHSTLYELKGFYYNLYTSQFKRINEVEIV